ncbi:MAG TPA: hypothetical protein VGK99_20730 [Acidobacteriota bacterium]|jgi:hypothetical protein
MDNEKVIRQKAEAFDRLVQLYRELEKASGLASASWVIFAEELERELREIEGAEPK